jgi:hypothetical protein
VAYLVPQDPPALVEPAPAPTFAVSGIASIHEVAGGLVCFTLFQELPGPEGVERQIVLRVLVPRGAVMMEVQRTIDFLRSARTARFEGLEH